MLQAAASDGGRHLECKGLSHRNLAALEAQRRMLDRAMGHVIARGCLRAKKASVQDVSSMPRANPPAPMTPPAPTSPGARRQCRGLHPLHPQAQAQAQVCFGPGMLCACRGLTHVALTSSRHSIRDTAAVACVTAFFSSFKRGWSAGDGRVSPVQGLFTLAFSAAPS